MKHTQILKRSWQIFWNYKTLWVLGFILALVSASGGGSSGGGSNSGYRFNQNDTQNMPFNMPPELQREFNQIGPWFEQVFRSEAVGTWIAIGVAVICVLFLISLVFAAIRYVTETSIIRMVDQYETSGEKVKWTQGLRMGWNRSAFRLFLIDLVIGVPIALAMAFLFACALAPAFLNPAGFVFTIGGGFLLIFLAILVGLAVNLLTHMMWRACVIDGLGVFDSIRKGWAMLKTRFIDIFLMGLLNTGIRIGYGLVVIPLVLLLLGIGLVAGGGIGVALYFALKGTGMLVAILVGVLVGFFVMGLVIGLPMAFTRGLLLTYISTDWTLAYRELKVLLAPVDLPAEPVEPAAADEPLPTA